MSVMRFASFAAALLLLTGAAGSCGSADSKSTADSAAKPTTPADSLRDAALMNKADQSRILGPDTAMWVVMISDFQCPYCKRWHDESMVNFKREFVDKGKVRFAYLHLPLESIHPHARAQAEASLCAGVQGKFWQYEDAIFAGFETVKGMSSVSPLLSRYAKDLQLDVPAFEQCRKSPAIKALVSNDIAQASQAGVQSTPSFILGEYLVQGALPWPDFRRAVDSALAMHNRVRAKGTPSRK
ncbi:MAG: DsbA family protein [Gemmatimonadaceae bacterium]|nr:DsbA family protein [Gemmatimonadaceae bacterium]